MNQNDNQNATEDSSGNVPHSAPASQVGAQAARPSDLGAEVRLPRPPGVFRRWLTEHPRVVDGIIVGVYLFGCAFMFAIELLAGFVTSEIDDVDTAQFASLTEHFTWPWMIVRVLIILFVALALAYRRRFPLIGLLVILLTSVLEQGLLAGPNSVALVFLLYALPVYRSVAAGWLGYAAVVVTNTLTLFLANSVGTGFIGPSAFLAEGLGPVDTREALSISVVNALWLLAILLIAINLGNRRRYVQALIERAYQLAREREQQAELAAAAERSRIAREMHDIVAHSLSVVVTLSEAASVVVETQPIAAQQAMERAAETGRSALIEMRRLLGVLGEGHEDHQGHDAPSQSAARLPEERGGATASLRPQPGASQIGELIDGFRQAGLKISFTEKGVEINDASHQLAVFRIIQEGLTNALRYAGRGAEVKVDLSHTAEQTSIEVNDSGPVAGRPRIALSIPGSGRGLTGASERARMFGGTFEAGQQGTGWRLAATVPITNEASETLDRNRI